MLNHDDAEVNNNPSTSRIPCFNTSVQLYPVLSRRIGAEVSPRGAQLSSSLFWPQTRAFAVLLSFVCYQL